MKACSLNIRMSFSCKCNIQYLLLLLQARFSERFSLLLSIVFYKSLFFTKLYSFHLQFYSFLYIFTYAVNNSIFYHWVLNFYFKIGFKYFLFILTNYNIWNEKHFSKQNTKYLFPYRETLSTEIKAIWNIHVYGNLFF